MLKLFIEVFKTNSRERHAFWNIPKQIYLLIMDYIYL